MERKTEHTSEPCWIVGLDLSPRSLGALRLARWLHERTHGETSLVGVHAIETRWPGSAQYPTKSAEDSAEPSTDADEPSLPARALALAQSTVDGAGAGAALRAVEVVDGDEPAEALRQRAEALGCGIIVGRAQPIVGWSLVSLGSVARRLLRRCDRPLCVVPPDLQLDRLGGPVLVAITDDETSVDALRMATALAHRLERAVVATHAVGTVDAFTRGPGARESQARFPQTPEDVLRHEQSARLRLEHWAGRCGLPLPELHLHHGRAAPGTAQRARELEACLIVCGSRQLSTAQRLLQSSVGTDLAAHADRPVLVVPEGAFPAPSPGEAHGSPARPTA